MQELPPPGMTPPAPTTTASPPVSTPAPAPGEQVPVVVRDFSPFDEYKAIMDDTTTLGNRRQTTNNIYLSVNSLLVGALTLLVQNSKLTSILLLGVELVVCVVGFTIARQWKALIASSRKLARLRFKALREFEDSPLFPGTIKIFHREDDLYAPEASGEPAKKRGSGASYIEERLPQTFQAVYLLGAIALVVLTLANRSGDIAHLLQPLIQQAGHVLGR